jgi:hypothetical protein
MVAGAPFNCTGFAGRAAPVYFFKADVDPPRAGSSI